MAVGYTFGEALSRRRLQVYRSAELPVALLEVYPSFRCVHSLQCTSAGEGKQHHAPRATPRQWSQ